MDLMVLIRGDIQSIGICDPVINHPEAGKELIWKNVRSAETDSGQVCSDQSHAVLMKWMSVTDGIQAVISMNPRQKRFIIIVRVLLQEIMDPVIHGMHRE